MSAETTGTDHVVESEHHEEKPRYDDINTGVIVLIGVITTIVTIITIAFVQGLTYHWEGQLQQATSYDVVDTPAKAEVDAQKEKLNYDPATGGISIDDAIKQVAEEYGQKGEEPNGSDETSTSEQTIY